MDDHIAIVKEGITAQIGTAEEIVASPADEYVREFTEEVTRYRVLGVGKITKPTETVSLDGSAPETESALAVVNTAGALVGEINQSMILKAMNSSA